MIYSKNSINKSFINGWRYLQDMNQDNNIFMLLTKNNDLCKSSFLNMNIYDILKELEKEDRTKFISDIRLECKENIWYFFREIARVRTLQEYNDSSFDNECSTTVPFPLSKDTLKILYLYSKGHSLILKYDNDDYKWKRINDVFNLLTFYLMIFEDGNIYTDSHEISRNSFYDIYKEIFSILSIISPEEKFTKKLININKQLDFIPEKLSLNLFGSKNQDLLQEKSLQDLFINILMKIKDSNINQSIILINNKKFNNLYDDTNIKDKMIFNLLCTELDDDMVYDKELPKDKFIIIK